MSPWEIGGRGRDVAEALDYTQGVLSQNWSGNEPKCTATCMIRWAANQRFLYPEYLKDDYRNPEEDAVLMLLDVSMFNVVVQRLWDQYQSEDSVSRTRSRPTTSYNT
ncbi:hypothetical protein TNCV_558301 [Trichonephila clavipes]|nr:hypothetical protein TNCV_558301 [Trichonephila clavipes]